MSKHTPAPWQILNTANIFTGLGAPRADGVSAPSDDGWMVADCDAGSLPLDEIRANAQLIAAAPELLEKLDQLVAVVGLTAFKHEGQRAVLQQAVDEANAAIAKATGEQP